MPTTDNPVRKYKNKQTSNGNRGVVKCLNGYWVGNRQGEENRNGEYPKNSNPTHNDTITAQVERPTDKVFPCQGHP